ncbi:MAG: sigma-70 family RNA polymerase sigma factor [Acidimicrobiia bacterium]|nr:sigma-70 family RNA polymerase sigma factor [Acidimicrobiia bacterium]
MTPAHPEDGALVDRIEAGDHGALAEAYEQHASALVGLATGLTRNRTLADDVVQEVFTRLWRRPGRYDADRGSLRTFLLRDTHGRAIDLIRSESARKSREDREAILSSGAGDGPESEVWDAVRSERVRAALENIPEREREAIQLAYYGGLSYREVARQLAEAEGTVKSRIRTGLQRLRGPLMQEGLSP